MSFLDSPDSQIKFFRNAYIWILFGGVGEEDFELEWSAVPLVFSGILVSVLILNIIIAYLSNEFSRLEELQFVNNWKQKALQNLNFDLIFWVCMKKKHQFLSFWKFLQIKRKKYHKIRTFYDGRQLHLKKNVIL